MGKVVPKYKIQADSGCLQVLIEQEENEAGPTMVQRYSISLGTRWHFVPIQRSGHSSLLPK
jgi:hypothetical protein